MTKGSPSGGTHTHYSHQMPRSNSEGPPERFNHLLRAMAKSNHRLQLDYILDIWTLAWAHLNLFSILPILSSQLSNLLFAN